MLDFSIHNIGCYTLPEKFEQVIQYPCIALVVSGLKYSRMYHPDGQLISEHRGHSTFFRLALPGMRTAFEYGENRENWVIMFKELPVRYSAVSDQVIEIQDGDDWIRFPANKNVPEESLPRWKTEMRNMRELFLTPLPQKRFKLKLTILSMFDFMLSDTLSVVDETPAGKLKRLIDEDNEFEKTITELSRKSSYSRDYLRLQFHREFQISPQEYRAQKRMASVMDYVCNTVLTVNEIAIETGFDHTSHLCKTFKKHFGKTVSQAIKQFRYR